MPGKAFTVLSLAFILSIDAGSAHGFSLMPSDGAGAAYPAARGAYTLAAGGQPDQPPPVAPAAAQSGGQGYTAEPIFSLEFPKVLVRDVVYTITAQGRWDKKDWLIFGAGVAAVAAVSLLDKPVRTQVQHIQNGSALDVAKEIRQFGGPYSYGVLGLFLAGGEVFNNAPAKAVFIDGAAATIISGGIALGLKYGVGRSRPSDDQGNSFSRPFSSSGQSFPSGETTQAFAVASVIASHYDDIWIKGASYGIASLVGMARIYEDAHWTSDALAGAFIGTAVGCAIVHFNDRRRSGPEKKTRFLITPVMASNRTGGVGVLLLY
jgi:membrane-associated phospholipid phosphatase